MAGPLQGLKVVEMAGLGPAPFCAMMLADMGADVVRIERPSAASVTGAAGRFDVTARGRRVLALDLKNPSAIGAVLALVDRADVLIEGFRPGVMERLGLGPDVCMARRPSLVYGRMTGWGQTGPLARAAGHDINYIAISGALHAIGSQSAPPVPPLNYVGDFGGGAMMLAFGILCALHHARGGGAGQVVDAAMTDGAALLSAMMYGMHAAGAWSNRRGENMLDGGAHFYGCYACADGRHVSIGSIEPQFYAQLLERTGITDPAFAAQLDAAAWPALKVRLAEVFLTKTRDEWCALMEGSDVCFAPVLDWDEAPQHPHNLARQSFVTVDGVVQPAPAPRFSGTPPAPPRGTAAASADAAAIFSAWGIAPGMLQSLRNAGLAG
ncbi:CaiB/BaiF CoA transferase family protein [Noviherbaspirillum suwonense]|uniref:Alpha-methylacyl-CoA racemase n=1 Tax=Noviherbaspirillum suwonense TaxID=1224511 RepID=A0ABY1Q0B9_9BURK|nr:CaiB/BaiF CoA-transferase family protein [Noviherbaspirillum suwonense]SMP55428.1 alpha-methylacyl-CoA racemase [Noviherbaspirillum suwonense]